MLSTLHWRDVGTASGPRHFSVRSTSGTATCRPRAPHSVAWSGASGEHTNTSQAHTHMRGRGALAPHTHSYTTDVILCVYVLRARSIGTRPSCRGARGAPSRPRPPAPRRPAPRPPRAPAPRPPRGPQRPYPPAQWGCCRRNRGRLLPPGTKISNILRNILLLTVCYHEVVTFRSSHRLAGAH